FVDQVNYGHGWFIPTANGNSSKLLDNPYSALVFYVKGSNPSMNFKIELKSPNNGVEYYYVDAGTKWTKVVVPFSKMSVYTWTKPVDFSRLIQMTFVFENNVDSIKEGTIYVARIGFS
ncbi:MAG: hypothetical protein ACP5NR_02755, partial [Athalassotoga sp.]|uniref:hypothetical protein n=1 Tax=Athalassotoga sp. TaxID=2022597 RepID=UPI003D018A32